jgi:CheY-like chemotaxis protein
MTLQDEDVLLEALAKDIMVINSQRAKEKNIQLSSELSPALPRCVRTDKTKLVQILINLVGNAIKFTPAGKRVSLQINSDNGTLNVHVKDEGVGIAEENIDKVFRPFQQVESSESQLYAGSGLGLTICRELADFLGGSLNVSSQLNEGSEFILRLPLVAGNESLVQSDLTLKALDLSDKNILVIEDNRVNQLVIKAMLKATKARLSFADNGSDGIAAAKQTLPDLILIDIRLPDMDGFSILSQLKTLNGTAEIPMIIVSGDVTNENYQKAEKLGAEAFIEKPLDELKLMVLLEQIFKL